MSPAFRAIHGEICLGSNHSHIYPNIFGRGPKVVSEKGMPRLYIADNTVYGSQSKTFLRKISEHTSGTGFSAYKSWIGAQHFSS